MDCLVAVCREALLLARATLAKLGPAGSAEVRDDRVTDIATAGDRAVAAALTDLFAQRQLPAVLLSEEIGRLQLHPQPHLTVAVDELDGTDNYSRGQGLLPCCTVVTVFDRLEPRLGDACVAGVIEHNSGHVWLAQRGGGCTLDGTPAHTSRRTRLDRRALVTVDHYGSRAAVARLADWYDAAWVKDFGAAAFHLAGVSSGLFDAYAAAAQKAHELGAGYLLLRESGGCLLDWDGHPLDDAVLDLASTWQVVAAASPELAQGLLRLVRPLSGRAGSPPPRR